MPSWFLRFVLALAAALTLALAASPANAQAGVAGKPLKVCVLRDTGGVNAAELIRQPGRFDCRPDQYKLGAGDYWAISEDINLRSRSRAPLNARIASLWQQRLALHVLYADGSIRTLDADGRGITRLIQLGAQVQHAVPRHGAEVVRLMWHVKGSANMRGIVLGARLATNEESARANMSMAAMYAAFAGLCIALIVYNLALWGALRHRFQLYYCLMVAALLGYAFSSSGTLAWVFPDIANNDRMRINYLALGAAGATALVFARSFFEERVFEGWLGRVTAVAATVMAATGAIFFLFAPLAVHFVDGLFTAAFLAMASVVVPTLWRAWRMRSNYLWIFAIAWGAPILTAILRAMANLHLIPWNFWLDNSTILSMAAEALLSSLAIAYRIQLLSRERDEAILGEELARRLAETDPLTGLLNRRAFLEQAIGRKGDQVLQIADLDHFKRVNDTLGHDGGDEVLRVFARMLRNSVPGTALVSRIGGEEFAILSAAGETVEPEILLARLRATRMPFDLKITTSIGSCTGTVGSERDWKALYRGADAALFEAKSAGRDRARQAPARAAAA
jgi:diguanylate cyclase (GGDEF)-like protein